MLSRRIHPPQTELKEFGFGELGFWGAGFWPGFRGFLDVLFFPFRFSET